MSPLSEQAGWPFQWSTTDAHRVQKEPMWRLAACPLVAWTSGLAYVFGAPVRTAAPSFDAAKQMFPIKVWGAIFLVQAVSATIALVLERSTWMAVAMYTGGSLYLWWSVCFAIQAFLNPRASLVAWAPYGFVVLLHYTTGSRIWGRRRLRRVE